MCVGASQIIPLSVLARNPHKGPVHEISQETGSRRGKEGPRETRIGQSRGKGHSQQKGTEETSRQNRSVRRSQKGGSCDLLSYRYRVDQREK